MIIGKVVEHCGSRKESELTGLKFLAVSPIDLRTGEVTGGGVVAVMLWVQVWVKPLYGGSSARQTGHPKPASRCNDHGDRRHV